MRRVNIDGTVALLRAAAAAGVERSIYTSSVAALGLTADGSPADETTISSPRTMPARIRNRNTMPSRRCGRWPRRGRIS